jgi:uncharacterized protein (DUF2252 family)
MTTAETWEVVAMAERAARGKAAREAVGRASHGAWRPGPERGDVVELLGAHDAGRVAELIPVRYGRMLVSPFTFYRGAAAVMAADLGGAPHTGLHAQLCGDAHLSNFGMFASPDRRLVFSINDFDEALPGPFEWDAKRLVASFAVAGRDLGFSTKQREAVNTTVVRAYRDAMAIFARMSTLDIWYARLDVDLLRRQVAAAVSGALVKEFERNIAKARAHDSLGAFSKLTRMINGQPRIVANPPLIVPVEDLLSDGERGPFEEFASEMVRSYRHTLSGDHRRLLDRFHYVHAARKVVGVGSVGTRAWIVLMIGNDNGDPLLLQLKEAGPSVLEPFLGASEFASHGQRVVEGQRMMQAASDIMLGWVSTSRIDGVNHDFYVRQLWDGKGSVVIDTMTPRAMSVYAAACGWTLARAHARSGDPVAIASYLGSRDTFDRAMASFAELYADQNERDFATFRRAVAAGKVTAQTDL